MLQFEVEVNSIKLTNGKYHLEAMNTTKILNEKLEEFILIKTKILEQFAEADANFKKKAEEFHKMKIEFENAEKNHDGINNTLKVIIIK